MKSLKGNDADTARKSDTTVIMVALLIVVAGGMATLLQLHPWSSDGMEIVLPGVDSAVTDDIQVYVYGGVDSSGWYPCTGEDSIDDIISMAGGSTATGDINAIKLYIPAAEEVEQVQLVSINRADAWLLDALPGIGPTSAQRIIEYREANGPFVTVYELLLVPGIGESTLENIEHLITVE